MDIVQVVEDVLHIHLCLVAVVIKGPLRIRLRICHHLTQSNRNRLWLHIFDKFTLLGRTIQPDSFCGDLSIKTGQSAI